MDQNDRRNRELNELNKSLREAVAILRDLNTALQRGVTALNFTNNSYSVHETGRVGERDPADGGEFSASS